MRRKRFSAARGRRERAARTASRTRSNSTKDEVPRQCAAARKINQLEMTAQIRVLQDVTGSRFGLGWSFCGRQPLICEFREDFALRRIPTRAFAANALYLEVVRLAYNLVIAFQRTCLPEEWQSLTLSKLRHRLLWLPGELTRPQNRPTLRLANSPIIQAWTEKILYRAHKLKPLEH